MKQIRISIDEKTLAEIKERAELKSLSLSSMGRSLLTEKIRETTPKGEPTKEHLYGGGLHE